MENKEPKPPGVRSIAWLGHLLDGHIMLASHLDNLLSFVVSLEQSLRQPKYRIVWRQHKHDATWRNDSATKLFPAESHVIIRVADCDCVVAKRDSRLDVVLRMLSVMSRHLMTLEPEPAEGEVKEDSKNHVCWPSEMAAKAGDQDDGHHEQ